MGNTTEDRLVWISNQEYCELRGIHPVTAAKERSRGDGPPPFQATANGRVRYRLSDVLRFMQKHTRKTTRSKKASA